MVWRKLIFYCLKYVKLNDFMRVFYNKPRQNFLLMTHLITTSKSVMKKYEINRGADYF